MGLFDIFTGDPAKEAAAQMRQYYDQTKTQGTADITGGLTAAKGYVTDGGLGANTGLNFGYGAGTGAVNTGADQALGYLGQGSAGALNYLGQAGQAYDPLAQLSNKYGGATSLALGALGVNGQAGTDAARSAFSASPGYNFNLEQGLNAINRRRAAGGMLDSGNADRDAQTFGAGLASNEYGNWMNQLLGFTNPEMQSAAGAAAGRSGALTNSANIANTSGQNQAGVASQRGAMLADLAQRYGTGTAGLSERQGNTLAGLETGAAGQKVGLATSFAQPYANTYKDEANAEMAGSGNLWNLGLNLAKLGVGAYGGSGK